MKIFLLVVIACTAIFQSSSFAIKPTHVARNELGINPRLVEIGNHSYFISTQAAFPDEAAISCEKMDMKLISLETEEKDKIIMDYLKSTGNFNPYWSSGQLVDGSFQWTSTGEPFTYLGWAPGQPDGGGSPGLCVLFRVGSGTAGWFDVLCFGSYFYICE